MTLVTKCNESTIKLKKEDVNFNSYSFRRGLVRIRKENEQIDNYSKIDYKRMYHRIEPVTPNN
jgi:stress response protein YsnF